MNKKLKLIKFKTCAWAPISFHFDNGRMWDSNLSEGTPMIEIENYVKKYMVPFYLEKGVDLIFEEFFHAEKVS